MTPVSVTLAGHVRPGAAGAGANPGATGLSLPHADAVQPSSRRIRSSRTRMEQGSRPNDQSYNND
jgi:hypothetical protein